MVPPGCSCGLEAWRPGPKWRGTECILPRPAHPACLLAPGHPPALTTAPPLPPPQAFYESQQGTTRGFMRMAVSTLAMLNTLVENSAVRAGFMAESVAPRAAAAVSQQGGPHGGGIMGTCAAL